MEPIKDFEKIHLNLANCIVPKDRLVNTPSQKLGMSHELEVDLRITGCEYIQTGGLLLQLPQVAMATAQVLFQRFYYAKSFTEYKVRPMAMACLFVAAKIEEDCRKIRDVVNVFHHLSQKRTGRPIVPMDYMGDEYFSLKPLVIKYERRLLKELGFCVHVKHPHKLIVTYLQILEMEKNASLAQRAWNYMNDSLRTNVFVRFSPETIACACIYLAARQLKIVLPQKPAWYSIFGVEKRDLEDISLEILALYVRPKKNLEELERDVAVIKIQLASSKQIEIREVKLKKNEDDSSAVPSPSSASQQSQPKAEETNTATNSASQPAELKPTVSNSSSGASLSTTSAQSTLSQSQESSSIASSGSSKKQTESSPVRNGDKQPPPRSLSLSPVRWRRTSRSLSPSPKRRTSQSDHSRSRSRSPPPPAKRRRTSRSPKPIISPIKFFSSSESHSERSNSLSPSPPPPPAPPPVVSLSSRENGLPRQYRQDYHEHKSRHKHRSHKDKREHTSRHRDRDAAEKERRKHRHRRERERDYYDILEREKGHYSGSGSGGSLSRRDRERDFDREREREREQRDRDYYRKSDPSRYR